MSIDETDKAGRMVTEPRPGTFPEGKVEGKNNAIVAAEWYLYSNIKEKYADKESKCRVNAYLEYSLEELISKLKRANKITASWE